MGKSGDLIEFIKDRLGHDFRYSLNSEKVRREIGWKAEIKFEEGVKKTVNWYLDNMSWVNSKLNYLIKYWETMYKNKH
jgi:dTDP-glucose 4,6-dehydratase